MSFAYVSSPGVPAIRPWNLSGVGTVLLAGRWSTSSVVMRASCRCSLILAVYAESMGCWATAGAATIAPNAIARTVLRNILPPEEKTYGRDVEIRGGPAFR